MSGSVEDRLDRLPVALHDVERASRQARLAQQVGQQQGHRRILLAGLEHERVAGHQRVAEHPHRHHGREVERRDAGDDAERLADLIDVDPGRDLLAEATLEQVRHAAGELDVLQAAGDLADASATVLRVAGPSERDLLAVGVHQFANRNMTSARRQKDAALTPGTRRARSRRPAHLGGVAASTSACCSRLPVVDRQPARAGSGHGAAVDPVTDLTLLLTPPRSGSPTAAAQELAVARPPVVAPGRVHEHGSAARGQCRPCRRSRSLPREWSMFMWCLDAIRCGRSGRTADVGVRAGRDDALAGKAEHPGRRRRDRLTHRPQRELASTTPW